MDMHKTVIATKKGNRQTQDTQIVLPFARLCGKNLQADFDGGTVSSDGGVLLFREIEAQVRVIRRFAGALDDPRDARYTAHRYEELLRQHRAAIHVGRRCLCPSEQCRDVDANAQA